MNSIDVSIILVSFNTKDLTRNCIKSVYENTTKLNFDIWVVDNASTDGSGEMIKSEFPQVKLISSDENLGFGRANNVAINKSQAKYVFLLNTDTVLVNNAVKMLFDFMEKEENTKVGACGGQLYNSDMTKQASFGEFDELRKLRNKAYGINFDFIKHRIKRFWAQKIHKQKDFYNDHKPVNAPVDYIIGADLMLRKSILNEVGLFDDRFFMYCEESELQFRIKKQGHEIMFVSGPEIIHYGGSSSLKANKPVEVETMMMNGTVLFFKICYGENDAKEAKSLYIIYHFRYLFIRFFSPKSIQRFHAALKINI